MENYLMTIRLMLSCGVKSEQCFGGGYMFLALVRQLSDIAEYYFWELVFLHLNISQFPDLAASNNVDVPKMSDTMRGELKTMEGYTPLVELCCTGYLMYDDTAFF